MSDLVAKSTSTPDRAIWVKADDAGALHTTDRAYSSSVTFTRPANTTAYTAIDVVGAADAVTAANAGDAIHVFTNMGPAGGLINLRSAALQMNITAIPASMTTHTLHLYNAAPAAILDNAAWDLAVAGDRTKYLGSIVFLTPTDLGSTLFSALDGINKVVKLAADSTTLYGLLVTTIGHTPESGMVAKITLNASGV